MASASFMLWEMSFCGLVLTAYVVMPLIALINRLKRPAQAKKSGAMMECEKCSVDLMHSLVPHAALPDYRFRGMHLKMSAVHVGFDDVGVKLKNGKCILEGVTGEFRPKKVAAIMGPSGAGKTTFMNALCGRCYYGTTSGEIRINGQVSSIAEIKNFRGFVPQDDIVHEHLTVREQLYYSARLRNAEDTSRKVIEYIVEDVLNVMQLVDVQHSLVGNVERRGISGGQRKRVNIGLELAARPSILMLDEPTSGLDASTALEIIRSVKRLTAIGMTVVMVVHQPRYSLFTLFDNVLLLGMGGRTVYLGESVGALPYFRDLGFKMPEHENPADWFMDVISGKVENAGEPSLKSGRLAQKWLEKRGDVTGQEAFNTEFLQAHDDRHVLCSALNEKLNNLSVSNDPDNVTEDQFMEMLQSMNDSKFSEMSQPALCELKQRIGFQDGKVSREALVRYFLGMRGSFSHDALTESLVSEMASSQGVSESSVSTANNSRGIVADRSMFGKRARFCFQYPVLVHQNVIRWMRSWRHKAFSTFLVAGAGVIFGAQCQDKLEIENILCPLKINLSHLALGLMTGIACLPIFGADRPMFWRESASGVRVSAFFLARVTVSLFDVLAWCYLFTKIWILAARAPCSYWLWLMSYRMTAVSAAGMGVLISVVVPEHSATLATSVSVIVMGGAISEPQAIGEGKESIREVIAAFSPFTWSIGQNYLALIAEQVKERGVGVWEDWVNWYAFDTVEGYQRILHSLGGDYTVSAYICCSVFGLLALLTGYLGLRWSHRGKQA